METQNKTKRILVGLLVILALSSTFLFWGLTGNAVKGNVIRVGVIGPLSGNFAYFGNQEQKGIELAKIQLEKEKGIKFKIIYEDSRGEPKLSTDAYNKLVNLDEVDFLIGDAWGTSTAPIVPFANRDKVILITPVAIQKELSADDYFFRTITTGEKMVEVLVDYAYNILELRKVGILYGQNPYGESHMREFEKQFISIGGEITGKENFLLNDMDVRTQLVKLKAGEPDAIYNLHSGGLFGEVLKQGKELDLDKIWLGHLGTENAPYFDGYGHVSDEVYYPHPFNLKKADADFVKLFEERYGELPNMVALNAYNALLIMVEAVESVGTDSDDLKNYLDNTGYFDLKGDSVQPIYMKRVINGKPEVLA